MAAIRCMAKATKKTNAGFIRTVWVKAGRRLKSFASTVLSAWAAAIKKLKTARVIAVPSKNSGLVKIRTEASKRIKIPSRRWAERGVLILIRTKQRPAWGSLSFIFLGALTK